MDPLSYLFSLEKLGIKFGLDNIHAICAALGHPEAACPSVIIAGTNGKGSVAAMVETGLRVAGHRTGLYTSPHLVGLEERFVIDGRQIDTESLVAAAATVRQAVDRALSGGRLETQPTFFEVTTAIGFELFRRAHVSFAVFEVGLGGRFDATNIVTPVAAAITTIDFDHERFLGHTIPAIAAEKAGVIKSGIPVVVGETKPEALRVFEAVCRERHATMIRAGDGVRAEILGFDGGRAVLDLRTPARTYGRVPLALRGRHQASNAVVAVRLLEEIDRLGTRVGADGVVAALGATRWPGRLDLLTDATGRQVLCDSAHNPAGARALAEYLREFHPAGLPIVFGIMKDKDVAGTLAPLIPFASRLFLTRAHTDRALPLGALAETARRLGRDVPSEIEPDPVMALERAWNHARLVCAAGSIFVVGELVGRLRPDDRRPPGGAH